MADPCLITPALSHTPRRHLMQFEIHTRADVKVGPAKAHRLIRQAERPGRGIRPVLTPGPEKPNVVQYHSIAASRSGTVNCHVIKLQS
jgi:hypothetical protein